MTAPHQTDRRFDEVVQVLDDYLDGIYFGDVAKLEAVLHPTLQLYCATDEPMLHMDAPTYLAAVKERASPASRSDARFDEIIAVEFAGPVTARVTLQTAYLPRVFTDFLTLVQLDGDWKIVAKVYHYELVEAD